MVIGLTLYSWDQREGSILEAKYPDTFEIKDSLMNKIYTTHYYSQDYDKEELIETNYEDQVIFSYCDKSKVKDVGYEIVVLIIHEKDKTNSYNLKKHLLEFSRIVINQPKEKRVAIFLENVKQFFEEPQARKVLLLGRAGTGKTTIRKIIFEGVSPKDLLYNPLAPTRGIVPSIYSWLDINLGLFDSSGQELPFLLQDEDEQKIAFENTEAVIYLFDFQNWMANPQEIIEEILKIKKIFTNYKEDAPIYPFLHKIDIMKENTRDQDLYEIRNTIQETLDIRLFTTSIYPDLIYSLYNAFYDILSSFSKDSTFIRDIIDEKIKDLSNMMCFITNLNNSIIVQTMTSDFNTNYINHSHKLVAQLNQTFEDMSENQIDHVILSSTNDLNLIMINLTLKKFNLKNLVCISESLNANKLILLGGQIRTAINRYLYYNKTV